MLWCCTGYWSVFSAHSLHIRHWLEPGIQTVWNRQAMASLVVRENTWGRFLGLGGCVLIVEHWGCAVEDPSVHSVKSLIPQFERKLEEFLIAFSSHCDWRPQEAPEAPKKSWTCNTQSCNTTGCVCSTTSGPWISGFPVAVQNLLGSKLLWKI